MTKPAVIYGHPVEPESFERYDADVHTSLAVKIPNLRQIGLTKFHPNPNGSNAPYYRPAELYFADPARFKEAFDSAEGQAAAADIAVFATGRATFISGETTEVLLPH